MRYITYYNIYKELSNDTNCHRLMVLLMPLA